MKKQKGFIGGLIAIVSFVGLVGFLVMQYVSAYNYGNRAEKTIQAEYTNMENILAQYSLQISEAAQVPKMQTDDLRDLFTGAISARYGETGSRGMMQWIQEQNPNLDQSTYLKLQTMIEAGRNKFENAQTKFVDTKRQYETNLGYLWRGFWLQTAGYPKIDLDNYVIISSGYAQDAFESKVETGIKLR